MEITLEEFLKKDIKDEVFIIETDTVYGLGTLMNSSLGAKKIYEIKEREEGKHFSLLVSNLNQVEYLTKNYEDTIDLCNKYWPGALTIIFKKSENVPDFVSNDDTVGLRMPDNNNTLKALEKFGPMIMTSVNKSGKPPVIKYNDCLKYIDKVDYIIKGDDLDGIPSTVYDAINNKVLRSGSVKIF